MAADIAAVEAELEALRAPASDERTKGHPRQAPKRRSLPEDLERVESRHEPSACTCGQCGGDSPLQFFVRRNVYPQYPCRGCETITAVPVAPTVIDRGPASHPKFAYSRRNRPPPMIQTGFLGCSESGHAECTEKRRQDEAGSPMTTLPESVACTGTLPSRDRSAMTRTPTSMITPRPTSGRRAENDPQETFVV